MDEKDGGKEDRLVVRCAFFLVISYTFCSFGKWFGIQPPLLQENQKTNKLKKPDGPEKLAEPIQQQPQKKVKVR